MNYRQLKLLAALDEHRNLTRVAEQLHVTTPAVSKALRDIEREFDADLFRRGARGVTPTVCGDCIIRHARSVLADLSNVRKELSALKDGMVGIVALGALPTAAPLLAPLAIVELKRRAPLTATLLREGTIDALMPELQLRKLDAIVGNLPPPRLTNGLTVEVLIENDPVVVVCRTSHPLTCRRAITWNHFLDYPWVIPPSDTSMRESFDAFLTKRHHPLAQNYVESGSIVSNKTYIERTDALGFFSKQIAEHFAEQRAITILKFDLGFGVGPIGTMHRKDHPRSPALDLMLDALRLAAKSISQRDVRDISARGRR